MFTNRAFIENVMKSTSDPMIMSECRRMIAEEEHYAEKRREKRKKRARKIKDEILAYCNSVNNPYASILEIANGTDRTEAQVGYYIRELIRDEELPERATTKKAKIEERIADIAKVLEYGKFYTAIDISKALNGKYRHNTISSTLYECGREDYPLKVARITRKEKRDGRERLVDYWIKA